MSASPYILTYCQIFFLTLPTLCISESCIEIKITYFFLFTLRCGASKGFMKAFKAFIKPFDLHKTF